MPSSHRFSDPAEENNILNHVISEDLQKYGFMYLSFPSISDLTCPTSKSHLLSHILFSLHSISLILFIASPIFSFRHEYFYTYYSPEFIGRIPRIVPLHPLTENDLVRIIQDPEDSLLSQVPHLTSITLLRILRIKVDSSINDYSV